jgi:iron complex transport system substrate-binding protein
MEKGVVESTHENVGVIASIFGMEDQVEEKFAGFDERIAALQNIAEGKTAVIGMCTSGSFNVLGNDGRCSIIGTEIGFDNLCKETSSERSGGGERGGQDAGEGKGEENAEGADNAQGGTATHGNEASFELIVSLNPDYIFVMDRDAAIGTEGAQLAKDIMENELVMGTDAYSNGNLVYLENPAVWYTAEGGITALETMLSDLETVLLQE